MKNPLIYQFTEYDCGPTSLLNGISYLFKREEIPPEVIERIFIYTLDNYNQQGEPGKDGTSAAAMTFLSSWLEGYGKSHDFGIHCRTLLGNEVGIGSEIDSVLKKNGVVILRMELVGGHYVVITGEDEEDFYLWDCYFDPDREYMKGISAVRADDGHPCAYNRIVKKEHVNRQEVVNYAMGPVEKREAVLLWRE